VPKGMDLSKQKRKTKAAKKSPGKVSTLTRKKAPGGNVHLLTIREKRKAVGLGDVGVSSYTEGEEVANGCAGSLMLQYCRGGGEGGGEKKI